MKILRIIDSMDPSVGGPCQGVRNSIAELANLGVENEVVCLNDPSAAFLGNDPFPVHALGPGKSPWHYCAKLIPWLGKNMARFDVLIVHGLWLFPSYAVWKAIKQHTVRPPYYIMPHGMLDPYFQQADSRKLKAVRNWLYWKLIEHKVVNEASGLLFTSETELLLARRPFRPYHPQQEINVGYGILDPPPFSAAMQTSFRQKCPGLDHAPYLLFLGRINYKKGVDLLIKAYAALLEKQPDSLPNLVVAGPELDSLYGQQIKRLVDSLPLISNRVFFPGMLTGMAKWGALYGCNAFILPSHQENFGIAVVEALACRKPVLISDQVNIWREIEAGGGGFVGSNSLEGTQQILQKWLAMSVSQQVNAGERARKTFENYFHIKQAARQLLKAVTLN